MVAMAADETPPPPDADDAGGERIEFGAGEKVLAGVLLVGSLALAYICLDVMSGGRITSALTRGSE